MFKNEEIVTFCDNVADQLEAGVTLSEAVERMVPILVKHSEKLSVIAASLKDGESFARLVRKHEILPVSMLPQIDIGEQTGKLDLVLSRLAEHQDYYFKMSRKAKSDLFMPVGIVFFTLIAFLGFLLFIFPIFGKNLSIEQQTSGIFYVSSLFVDVYEKYPWVYLLPIVFLGYLIALSKTNTDFKEWIFNQSLNIPIYGDGIRKMLYSAWCTNVSIALAAGMGIYEAISHANGGLAADMSEAFKNMTKDVEQKGWTYAITADNWGEEDPRHSLPLAVVTAISTGGELNKLDVTLRKASDKLIDQSQREVNNGIKLINSIATAIAVICIVGLAASLIFAQAANFQSVSGGM